MDRDSRIFIAGHRGLVGSAILRRLKQQGHTQLLCRSRQDLDLTSATAVERFFETERPEYVFLAAAKVGGILANSTYPADFLRDNLMIELNVIHSAWKTGVRKIEFLGSSCIYPKFAPQPIEESSLLTGSLEPTNEWYALAKIAGIKMCQAYRLQYGLNAISVMPTNLYGPGDNFDLKTSHVLPALIRKFHEAKSGGQKQVVVWGTGTPRREFLYVDDLAEAAIFLMRQYDEPEILNVGVGSDVTIAEVARLVAHSVGFEGDLTFDRSKPDGTPRKLLDVSKISELGWKAQVPLDEGIARTYSWFLEHKARIAAPTAVN